jgi:hypothetical protein
LLSDVGDRFVTAEQTGLGTAVGSYSKTTKLGDGAYGDKDVDLYAFQAAAGSTVTITTSQPTNGAAVDIFLRLFGGAGTEIAYNDDGGANRYSRLVYNITTTGTYNVGVSGFPNSAYDPHFDNSGISGAVGDYVIDFSLAVPPAGITVSPTLGLTTTEEGSTASFTVQLATQPTANVTVPISSSDTTEGVVSPSSLTFTSANWNVPQNVTVTGVDDSIYDGNINYTIVIGAATSTDSAYNGLDPADLTVFNLDNDPPPKVTLSIVGGSMAENGGTATVTATLSGASGFPTTIQLDFTGTASYPDDYTRS